MSTGESSNLTPIDAIAARTGFEGGVLAVVAVHESDKSWGLTALGDY